ncbi:MAG TPA: hypothetical protein VIM58_11555 [Candidatus Methylacidiphilales bacterium]
MTVHLHPEVSKSDLFMLQKALKKRGLRIDFDREWKRLVEEIGARAGERKAIAEAAPLERLVLAFAELRLNIYLQPGQGTNGPRLLVWLVEVGGRMDVPAALRKRNGVANQDRVAFRADFA